MRAGGRDRGDRDRLASIVLIEAFPTCRAGVGLRRVLSCFAGLSLLAVLFVSIVLPETKGQFVDSVTAAGPGRPPP